MQNNISVADEFSVKGFELFRSVEMQIRETVEAFGQITYDGPDQYANEVYEYLKRVDLAKKEQEKNGSSY